MAPGHKQTGQFGQCKCAGECWQGMHAWQAITFFGSVNQAPPFTQDLAKPALPLALHSCRDGNEGQAGFFRAAGVGDSVIAKCNGHALHQKT